MKNLAVSIIVIIFNSLLLFAQAPDTLWTKIFGGTDLDVGYTVQQTFDLGYIVVGSTRSFGSGNSDIWLIKTDSNGDTIWTKLYGGSNVDVGYSVQQTNDSGYVITGFTESYGAGGRDVWLIKTDQNGDTLWTKTFGGTLMDWGKSVKQTLDNGFIITGLTTIVVGQEDLLLIKTDEYGNEIWSKTYGGGFDDRGSSVVQTSDGGFVVTGWTLSFGAGGWDVWLLKTNSIGDTLWTKTFGGYDSDNGIDIEETNDEGYIIVGDYSPGPVGSDIWLIKTDSFGDTLWTKIFSKGISNWVEDVCQTSDSGYIICGYCEEYGEQNIWLIKTDKLGNHLWNKTLDGEGSNLGYSIQQTEDEGYIVLGTRNYYDDIWLIKLAPDPHLSVNLLYPNGGEYWLNGTTEAIAWTSESIEYVKIDLSTDNGTSWFTIVDSTASSGLYVWTVNCPTYSNECLIRVSELSNLAFYDISDSVFTIDIVPSVEHLIDKGIPDEFMLFQNFPNPFNPTTTIQFGVPTNCFVELKLYDILGKEVSSLISEYKTAGYYNVEFNASNLPSGIYFYRIKAGEFVSIKKMVLLK